MKGTFEDRRASVMRAHEHGSALEAESGKVNLGLRFRERREVLVVIVVAIGGSKCLGRIWGVRCSEDLLVAWRIAR